MLMFHIDVALISHAMLHVSRENVKTLESYASDDLVIVTRGIDVNVWVWRCGHECLEMTVCVSIASFYSLAH